MRRWPTWTSVTILLLAVRATTAMALSEVICAGDCNYDRKAAVNELVSGVNIALEHAAIDSCPGFDLSGDGKVAVNELVAGVGNALTGCPTARIVSHPCDITLPDGQDPAQVNCGDAIVAADRGRADGRTMRIPFAVLKATGANPAPDPLVYLGGGPGDPVLEGSMLAWTADFAAPVQEKRDVVFFDQRGAGRSQPALDPCPERQEAFREIFSDASNVEEQGQRLVGTLRTCHDRMVQSGADVTTYSSAAIAEDLTDLMTALGYRQWNVYGLSYGGRIALTAMRDTPASIRSVVLDSPLPIDVNHDADFAANAERQLNTLFEACARDARCDAAFPHLDRTFFDLVNQLNASPAVVHPVNADGEPFTVVVSGDVLLLGIAEAMADDTLIPFLPILIATTAAGNYGLLIPAAGSLAGGSDLSSYGLKYSVGCYEETPFSTPAIVEAATAGVREEVRRAEVPFNTDVNRAICQFWGSNVPPAVENAPVVSALPALILTGEFDSIRPYGQIAAQNLSRSFVFDFRGQGHVQIFGHYDSTKAPCAIHLIAAFLDDPTHAPDGSCVAAIPPPQFIVP